MSENKRTLEAGIGFNSEIDAYMFMEVQMKILNNDLKFYNAVDVRCNGKRVYYKVYNHKFEVCFKNGGLRVYLSVFDKETGRTTFFENVQQIRNFVNLKPIGKTLANIHEREYFRGNLEELEWDIPMVHYTKEELKECSVGMRYSLQAEIIKTFETYHDIVMVSPAILTFKSKCLDYYAK